MAFKLIALSVVLCIVFASYECRDLASAKRNTDEYYLNKNGRDYAYPQPAVDKSFDASKMMQEDRGKYMDLLVHKKRSDVDDGSHSSEDEEMQGNILENGRKILLLPSQEEQRSIESEEIAPARKVYHGTNAEDAGNGRQKSNYIHPRISRHNVVVENNESQIDTFNKLYKN